MNLGDNFRKGAAFFVFLRERSKIQRKCLGVGRYPLDIWIEI